MHKTSYQNILLKNVGYLNFACQNFSFLQLNSRFKVNVYQTARQFVNAIKNFIKDDNIKALKIFSKKNRPGGIRTHDQEIKSLLLYH